MSIFEQVAKVILWEVFHGGRSQAGTKKMVPDEVVFHCNHDFEMCCVFRHVIIMAIQRNDIFLEMGILLVR